VLTRSKKTRAQIPGGPFTFNDKEIKYFCYQMRQLEDMLKTNDSVTQFNVVDDNKPE